MACKPQAIPPKQAAKKSVINRESPKGIASELTFFRSGSTKSLIADELSAAMAESRLDMAAAKTPASSSPRNPAGANSEIKIGKALLPPSSVSSALACCVSAKAKSPTPHQQKQRRDRHRNEATQNQTALRVARTL